MADSPYFDGCYFDPAYFDASVCAPATTGGGHGKRATRVRSSNLVVPDEFLNDDEEALLVLEGF